MKIIYKYRWNHHEPVYGHPPYLVHSYRLLSCGETQCSSFEKYLLSALHTDFSENRHGQVDEALDAIQKIETGELDEFDTGGQSFWHHLTKSYVRFEHNTFGECPEWPIWCCALAQYKAALQGYRRFLDMPRSIESELVIELHEGEAPCN
jgi:hypothetical protein